mmetsp:Transcript_82455/g.133736  ORF Transcript_82455/g.133736 Transcript_82455/m.133736 type:complete len:96 (+) Transcript_82455:30-317(+)
MKECECEQAKESNIARASAQVCEKGGARNRKRARKRTSVEECVWLREVCIGGLNERERLTERRRNLKKIARAGIRQNAREEGGSARRTDEYDVQR